MKFVVADVETYYSKEYSLSKITTEEYIRSPEFKMHGVGIKFAERPAVWITHDKAEAALARIDWSDVALICHNTQFDAAVLAWHYGVKPKLYIDTLAMSRALLGAHSPRHSLHATAGKLLSMSKMDGLVHTLGIRDLSARDEARLADYCIGPPRTNPDTGLVEAGDCTLTWEIFKRMAPHFPRAEYAVVDWTTRAFVEPELWLDTDLLETYLAYTKQLKVDALEACGMQDRTVLMSNPKLAEALEGLGCVPPTKINAKGKVALAFAKTDEGFKALLDHPNPAVAALVAARLEVKSTIEETRAQRLLDASVRGPFPVPYNYAGATVTQRFSGGQSVNLQNLQRSRYDSNGQYIENTGMLRRSIYAPEGYVLGVADLAQIEARLVLWFGTLSAKSNGAEQEALATLAAGGDIYSWFGSQIYGMTISKHTHPTERQIAKSAVLGLGYGMGPARFLDYCKTMDIRLDEDMAERIVSIYRKTFTGVRAIWRTFDKAARAAIDGDYWTIGPVRFAPDPLFGEPCIMRPCGLAIKYPGLRLERVMDNDELVYTQGAATSKLFGGKLLEGCCQSIAGDLLRNAIAQINRHYRVVMSTHDELVMLVPEGQEAQAEALTTSVMTETPEWLAGLPLAIEFSTAVRYGDAK